MDNAASLFVDAPVDEGHGARPALLTPAGPVTYADLRRLTDRAAHALRARGVEPEQRVAILLPDGPAWVATFFAALKLGAVAVPLNTRLDAAQLRTILDDCRPKTVVADAAVLAAAGVDAEAFGLHTLDFDALVAGASDAALPPAPVGADAMAFWLYTSGTTGSPKAAVHCHRTLPACQHYLDVLGVTGADRIFATSKLFFAYALGNALLIPLRARATTYLHPGWPDPATVAAAMREIRPTLFFSVPTVYARLLHADLPAETFGSARLCVSAGERLPAELYARLAGPVRRGDPRRHRRHRDHLHGALQPAGPEPAWILGRAGAGHGDPHPGRGGTAGAGRAGGRALGAHPLAGRRVLAPPRPLAPDLRG